MLILGVFLLALAAGVVSTAFWVPEPDLGLGAATSKPTP